MKKKIVIIIFLIVIFSIGIIILLPKEEREEKEIPKAKTSEYISVMLQNEEGKYEKSSDGFPTEGYHFNKNKSKCINGSEIAYENNEVVVKASGTDKCYAYFDNNNFVEDLSGNGNHGINNGALWQDDGLLFGNENNFYGYVNCGLARHDFKDSATFIIKFKINKLLNSEHDFINNFEGGGIGLEVHGDGTFKFVVFTNNRYNPVTSFINPDINEWYLFVGTYDGNQLTLYTNGVIDNKINLTGNIKMVDAPIFIGGNPNTSGILEGNESYILVQEALVFDRALSEEEIASDYADNINPTNKDDLLLWYKFD